MCLLIIFGKIEREKFENSRRDFSEHINNFYNNTRQYHNGKWLYLQITNDTIIGDIENLLLIKKRPNVKNNAQREELSRV